MLPRQQLTTTLQHRASLRAGLVMSAISTGLADNENHLLGDNDTLVGESSRYINHQSLQDAHLLIRSQLQISQDDKLCTTHVKPKHVCDSCEKQDMAAFQWYLVCPCQSSGRQRCSKNCWKAFPRLFDYYATTCPTEVKVA